MMESRNSYGWGMTGSDKKGFEWELVDEYGKLQEHKDSGDSCQPKEI